MMLMLSDAMFLVALVVIAAGPSVPLMIYVAGHKKRMKDIEDRISVMRKRLAEFKVRDTGPLN